jgi:hypothetical protein
MPSSNQCNSCIHYEGAFTCAAFPDEIPDDIFNGFFDHRKAFPGDNGVRWEPIDPQAESTPLDA